MCDLILGPTAAGAPYTLAHRTNSNKRKKAKNKFKKANGIVAKETKRTKVQRALAQRALVLPVDEFRTSVTCSKCRRRLENKYERQKLVCNHKKKKIRLKEKKNATLRCLDDNKRVVC
ncbi:hypothetical protein RMCBS344292_08448 [Rhizopus microsporus]|nr:hypothetical protein RMCBS344292_08448 [Rhizopus microsporus]